MPVIFEARVIGRGSIGRPLCLLIASETRQNSDRPWHGGRALVCDDNLLIADLVAEFLRECGLGPVGPVGQLESAMHLAREWSLDGALLDIKSRRQAVFSDLRHPVGAAHPVHLAHRVPGSRNSGSSTGARRW
jgi:hypothetical protein